MTKYLSSNGRFQVCAHNDGHYGLTRDNSGLHIKDSSDFFELFALLCQVMTENVIPGLDWFVADYRETDVVDPFHEDDIPF